MIFQSTLLNQVLIGQQLREILDCIFQENALCEQLTLFYAMFLIQNPKAETVLRMRHWGLFPFL